MNRRGRLGVMLLALAGPAAGDRALAEAIVPGRCHMGVCGEMRIEAKTPLRSNAIGTLYEVRVAGRSWPMERPRPSTDRVPFAEATVSHVLCSTSRPAYIFPAGEGFSRNYLAHRLNPDGESWFGYNRSDYSIYWATCHNLVGPEFFSDAMVTRARQLGYPGNLPQEQIEIDDPMDLMR